MQIEDARGTIEPTDSAFRVTWQRREYGETPSLEGRVENGELPAATVARTVYHGDYDGLGEAWGAFGEWMAEAGHAAASNLWESYVTGPESGPDPAGWQTELNRPLAG